MENFKLIVTMNITDLISFTILACTLFITSCEEEKIIDPKDKSSLDMTPQEFFDHEIRKSEIVDSMGHMYYLYETGRRGCRNYSFSLEHRLSCKKCLESFD